MTAIAAIVLGVFILIVIIAIVVDNQDECPRIAMGYNCHVGYPGGCEGCGRGMRYDG